MIQVISLLLFLINTISGAKVLKFLDCSSTSNDYIEVMGMDCIFDRDFFEETVQFLKYNRTTGYCTLAKEKVLLSKDYVIRLSNNESFYRNPPKWDDKPECVRNINTYEISYLYENVYMLRKNSYERKVVGMVGNRIFEEVCNSNNFRVKKFNSIDPMEHRKFIRSFTRRFDVDGYVFNGSAYARVCKTVDGTVKFKDKTVAGVCYKETPIIVNGLIKFSSNMIDIQNIGTPVDCKTRRPLYGNVDYNYDDADDDEDEDIGVIEKRDKSFACPESLKQSAFDSNGYSLIAFLILTGFQLISIIIFISSAISYSRKRAQLEVLKRANREASIRLLSKTNSLIYNKRSPIINV